MDISSYSSHTSSIDQLPVEVYMGTDFDLASSSGTKVHLQDFRFLKVGEQQFLVNAPPLIQCSPVFDMLLGERSPTGLSSADPLILTGHNAEQFSAFLWAIFTHPLPQATETPLHRLFSIAEVSLKYNCEPLKAWALAGLRSIITSPSSILSVTPSNHLARMLRVTFLYQERDLSILIEKAWILRLHTREIHPIPAILMGNATNLRLLLSHAMYVHMTSISSHIESERGISSDIRLTPELNTHISCGYHSLLSCWHQLSLNPPDFETDERCQVHSACLRGWESRWRAAVEELDRYATPRMSPADVLGRLSIMQKRLQMDPVLDLVMTGVCKANALQSVRERRAHCWYNLWHHFDL